MKHKNRINIKKEIKGKKVLCLGVSYLNDVGDTRYTPVELLYNKLEQAGAEITLHDPFVSYWEEKDVQVEAALEQVLSKEYDAVLVTTMHGIYMNNDTIYNYLKSHPNTMFVDTWGIVKSEKLATLPNKVKVIGRGDI